MTSKHHLAHRWMTRASKYDGFRISLYAASLRKQLPSLRRKHARRTLRGMFFSAMFAIFGILTVFSFYVCQMSGSTCFSIADGARQTWLDHFKDANQSTPIKIAHVVSLISCARKSSRTKGFIDALIILRHSIHQNSVRNTHATNQSSVYDYQMIAVVNADDVACREQAPLLERLGYRTLLRPNPVNISAIATNEWYRKHVSYEKCCGADEFIKLHAFTLTEYPIVVHWDLDAAVLTPMDDLFDAMLFDRYSDRGQRARQRLELQQGIGQEVHKLPERIDAFFTRDVTSAYPWERVRAVQGGFAVLRPNMEHFQSLIDLIMQAKYTPGRGPNSGWGGLGYGGFQGAMAFQGILAYFYDMIHRGHAVELDVCHWNQVVADVIYRGPTHMEFNGTCRQYPHDTKGDFVSNTPEKGRCYDCRALPVRETRTVHFTACKKPWECTLPYPRVPGKRNIAHTYRIRELTNITTCRALFRKYFEIRQEVEAMMASSPGSFISRHLYEGNFEPDTFLGYCAGKGTYLPMEEHLSFDLNMTKLYGF
jgi:hypothetical protein